MSQTSLCQQRIKSPCSCIYIFTAVARSLQVSVISLITCDRIGREEKHTIRFLLQTTLFTGGGGTAPLTEYYPEPEQLTGNGYSLVLRAGRCTFFSLWGRFWSSRLFSLAANKRRAATSLMPTHYLQPKRDPPRAAVPGWLKCNRTTLQACAASDTIMLHAC